MIITIKVISTVYLLFILCQAHYNHGTCIALFILYKVDIERVKQLDEVTFPVSTEQGFETGFT